MRFPLDERRGLLLLSLLVIAASLVLLWVESGRRDAVEPPRDKDEVEEFRAFHIRTSSREAARHRRWQEERRRGRLFPFDPNTADSATLDALGLSRSAVRAIIHYRRAGGRFRTASDVARIYTLSPSDYRRIRPYISIPSSVTEPRTRRSPVTRTFPAKLREGESVDLNSCDTAVLMRVPGVGRVTAERIIKYGRLLGGYTAATQVREVYGMAEGAERYFHVTAPRPVTIDINKADFGALARHPYIGRKRAAEVMRLRRKYGLITSMAQLAFALGLGDEEREKLLPYLSFGGRDTAAEREVNLKK